MATSGSALSKTWIRRSALLCAWTLLACSSPEPNEVSLAACTDPAGLDEDDDGLANCDDPDCFGFVACGLAGELLLDGGVRPPPSGAGGSSGTDAGRAPPPRRDGGTSGTGGTSDAGEQDAATSPCGACESDEVCTDAGCEPQAQGLYVLTVTSATVPLATVSTRCYDCATSSIPYAVCTCKPDPFVRVFLVPATEPTVAGTELGATAPVTDDVMPTFATKELLVDLQPGYTLRFEVWDQDDAPALDEKMFECVPDLTDLLGASVSIDCLAQTGVGGLEQHHVYATLTPATQ